MKKIMMILSLAIGVLVAMGDYQYDGSLGPDYEIDGVRWQRYDIIENGMEDYCVIGCYSDITGDVIMPAQLGNKIVIGCANFNHCSSLTSLVIPEGVRYLPEKCFNECTSLITVDIPSTVTNIGMRAFDGCSKLKSIKIPDGVRQIKELSFRNCVGLESITLSTTITDIESAAFYNCRMVKSIIIPETITNIAGSVFSQCSSLTNVTILGDAPVCADWIFENAFRDLVVYVPVGSKGWNGNPESTALPKYWPSNTEGGRRIVHIGESVDAQSTVVTNYIYSTVTNYVFSTITNVVHHYTSVTNVEHIYTTVTNVVRYVPEPRTSPDAGYAIGMGENKELAIAGAVGWDAFGVPDGMAWDKETGTLSGQAKLSGTYDVMLVSGSGADTQIMRTTITVAPFDKIIGYVGVAFSHSGTPLDILKSYKTLPAGLKWKDGVLSGVPTKAQTLDLETVDGEPVSIEIKPLPDSVVGTFDGCVYLPPSNPTNGVARPCDIIGTVSLTTTAAGKISASVKTAQKTYSISATSWAKFAEGDAFTLEGAVTLKTGETLQVNAYVNGEGATTVLVKLSGGEFDGHAGRVTLPNDESGADGCVTEVVKDKYAKVGGKWPDGAAHELMAGCAGTYLFGFDRTEAPEACDGVQSIEAWTLRSVAKQEAAFLKVVLKDTGVATITGTLPDNTKVNCSAKATAAAEGAEGVAVRITTAAFLGKTMTLPLSIEQKSDGSPLDGAENCGSVYNVKR